MTSLAVVIAEDHYLVRVGIRRALEEADDIDVVGTASDATELVALVSSVQPDVVVTDIRMPPGNHTDGIDAALALRAARADLGVVVISQYVDAAYTMELLRDGPQGIAYLLKERIGDPDQLIDAVHTVAAGGSVIDGDVVATLVERTTRTAHSPLAELTDRELDVLRGMAQGKTNAGIADALHLSQSSVEKYTTTIFHKLGLHKDDIQIHKRVTAVLTLLHHDPRHQGPDPAPTPNMP